MCIRERRIGYTLEDMAAYRAGVKRDIVPVVARLKALQHARTGVQDPKFYDDGFCFAQGNPAPKGTPVSYTHLDVYKRQVRELPVPGAGTRRPGPRRASA